MQNAIEEFISQQKAAMAALIEQTCEQSLTDEQQRGVLIIQNFFQNQFEVRLDPRVPYGHIYVAQKETDLDRFVSSSEEGGERA